MAVEERRGISHHPAVHNNYSIIGSEKRVLRWGGLEQHGRTKGRGREERKGSMRGKGKSGIA